MASHNAPLDRKARLQLPAIPVRQRDPLTRTQDFGEITLPYTRAEAIAEASRCLQCPQPPCQAACPLHNDIPRALALLSEGRIAEAAQVYRETNPLPDICGRICPQHLCEDACVLAKTGKAIHTRQLEAFVADEQVRSAAAPLPAACPSGSPRVAIVGTGPAGLAVAEQLLERGYQVTLHEQHPHPGGLLQYGIPSFKANPRLIQRKVAQLQALGATFHCNCRVGEDITVPQLLERYDAVFLGVGAQEHLCAGLPGETLEGVYNSTDFLIRANVPPELLPPAWQTPLEIGPRVHVQGGGGTAMDCLRTALRLPGVTEATCYYRRGEAEMPSPPEDHRHALEEGARFEWLVGPLEFLGDNAGKLRAVVYQEMMLCEPDESGRCRPVPIPGATRTVEADTVIMALGYMPEADFMAHVPGLQTDRKHRIQVNDRRSGQTHVPRLFAAGDVVRGADLVAPALADALSVARAIDAYLRDPERRWPTPRA